MVEVAQNFIYWRPLLFQVAMVLIVGMVVVVEMVEMVAVVDMAVAVVMVVMVTVVVGMVVVDKVDLSGVEYLLANLYCGEYKAITILISVVDLCQLTVIVTLGGVSLAYHMSMWDFMCEAVTAGNDC